MTMKTEFAPAERATTEEVERQHKKLAGLPFVGEFLDSIPNMSVVLNAQRQIVFANRPFAEFVGAESPESLLGKDQCDAFACAYRNTLGLRPGEAVGCIRAALTEGGCGTTRFCKTCGAVMSILNSQSSGTLDIQECRMVCGADEQQNALDLRVWSRPITVAEETFTVFSVVDISNEKRRSALERIFFHDVLNTDGGIKGLADLLIQSDFPEEEVKDVSSMISETSDQLVEEIRAQRILTAAENGELAVDVAELHSLELLYRIIRQFHSYSIAEERTLDVDESAGHFDFTSDPVLIRRVLINLVKNALEAVPPGGKVTLNCFRDGERVCFTVHNSTVMPPDVKLQLFTRSFSTKGSGRGLGTYSIKLITERYLKGTVSFVSNEEEGTLFTVCYPEEIAAEDAA
jgi:K+-sensing histidine kinase KdpD